MYQYENLIISLFGYTKVMDHVKSATTQAITMVVSVMAVDMVDGEAAVVADRQVIV